MSDSISLFKRNKNFRNLYLGQFVSQMGTFITVTVVPIQVYQLTQSSAMVGWISLAEWAPLVITSLLGGAFADHFNRKKLLVVCECLMALGIIILTMNSLFTQPNLIVIFLVSAFLQAVNGFHRPAMDSLIQSILEPHEIPLASGLNAFKMGFVTLSGPCLGGILISTLGAPAAYLVDLVTYVFSVAAFSWVKTPGFLQKQNLQLVSSLVEGMRYAMKRQEILGTYLVDLVAMGLAFPVALFPAISLSWGHPETAGLMYSSLTIGSLMVPLFTRWASKVQKQGGMVILASGIWGVGILLFGLSTNIWICIACLVFAGMADTVSGLFRSMIWNQTIPNTIRGRMAGIEMISYMSGPLLGNMRAGWVASVTSTTISLVSGGALCILSVLFLAFLLPHFREYISPQVKST